MSADRPEPVRIQLPTIAWAGVALLLVMLFGTFWFMTKVLLDQRHLIDSQNRKAYAQLERACDRFGTINAWLENARRR